LGRASEPANQLKGGGNSIVSTILKTLTAHLHSASSALRQSELGLNGHHFPQWAVSGSLGWGFTNSTVYVCMYVYIYMYSTVHYMHMYSTAHVPPYMGGLNCILDDGLCMT